MAKPAEKLLDESTQGHLWLLLYSMWSMVSFSKSEIISKHIPF